MNLRHLKDEELLLKTKTLATKEREIMIEVLHHLVELNQRKLFSPRFRTIFEYATVELGYSADQASRRLDAMRLLKELPEIEGKIASAELNLTLLGLAQTYFRNEVTTREEKIEILNTVAGKSTREATRELIKRSSQPERLQTETIRPVSATTCEVRLFLKDEVLEKIARLKGRLAHKHPHLSNSELFEILLDQALVGTDPAREPKHLAVTKSAAPRKRTPGAALKRQIFRESRGQCAMCGSIHALEYDHKTPFALGGLTVAKNLRLLCRNCNQRERVRVFG